MEDLKTSQQGNITALKMFEQEIASLDKSVSKYKDNIKDIIKLLGGKYFRYGRPGNRNQEFIRNYRRQG